MLSATGNPERAEILKQHADEEVCALVLSLLDKVAELHRRRGGSHDHDTPDTPEFTGEDGDDGRSERPARAEEQMCSGGT